MSNSQPVHVKAVESIVSFLFREVAETAVLRFLQNGRSQSSHEKTYSEVPFR